MRSLRFIAALINIAPIIIIATEKMVIAMANIDSTISEIGAADAAYRREFIAQVIVGVIAAIVLAYCAFRVFNAGNRLQDAINANAQARIEEAKAEGAKANKGLAEANVEIVRLRVETARANQQTVEISLKVEEEARKRLEAERALLELQERLQPRFLTAKQELQIIKELKSSPIKGTEIQIFCLVGDGEGFAFAQQIDGVLKKAGWTTKGVIPGPHGNAKGVFIAVQTTSTAPEYRVVLQRAFESIGIKVNTIEERWQHSGSLTIIIGRKP